MNPVNKPHCVLFDLDGTLIDTAPDLGYALNSLLAEHGRDTVAESEYRKYCSYGARGLLKLGFGIEDDDPQYETLRQRFLDIYADNLSRGSRPFGGMITVLQTLLDHGRQWGIITNKPAFLTEPLMAQIELPGTPCCLVSGDSAEKPKPDPAPMLLAGKISGHQPENCLYVGDSARDMQAAKAVNMPCVAAGWGYYLDDDDPHQWGGQYVLNEPLDLLQWI